MRKFLLVKRCKKYCLYRKIFQTKVARNKISSKKLNGRISLFTPGMNWEGGRGGGGRPKFAFMKYNAQKWEKNFYIKREASSNNSVG